MLSNSSSQEHAPARLLAAAPVPAASVQDSAGARVNNVWSLRGAVGPHATFPTEPCVNSNLGGGGGFAATTPILTASE